MNMKRTLPPLNMKNTSLITSIFSPPDAQKDLQQPSFFQNNRGFNKMNSIFSQSKQNNGSKSPYRMAGNSMSPMLAMPSIGSCKKVITNTQTSSPGLQIISPYLQYNSSVKQNQKKNVFNFKNINQIPQIAPHATTNAAMVNVLSPLVQKPSPSSSLVPNVQSSGSSGSITLALQHRLIARRAGKQQQKFNDKMIKQFIKSISSGSAPSLPSNQSTEKLQRQEKQK